MIESQFATSKIAQRLKNLGFNEPCLGIWDINRKLYCDGKKEYFESQEKAQYIFGNIKIKNSVILAPLWQQVVDWIEKEHKLHLNVMFSNRDDIQGHFYGVIEDAELENNTVYNSHQEACEQGIEKILDKLENKTIQ